MDGGQPAATELAWSEHEHLGTILTDGDGMTLYVFTRDNASETTCTGGCADAWPPVTAEDQIGGPEDIVDRLGTIERPDGTTQVTLDQRPLYRFAGDQAPGEATGQARASAWFVVRQSDAPGELNVDFLDGPGEHAVEGAEVSYGPEASGYLSQPAAEGTYPGVVMIHEWWGLNDNIRAMADALASHGYAVLAVDLFNGSVATTSEEARAQVQGLDQAAATANMRQAADHLRDQAGAPSVASLGWCFGGGQSLQLAISGEPLAATVLYYGTRLVTDEANLSAIQWPVQGIFGDQDGAIPVDQVEAFDQALGNLSIEHEVHLYEGVGHAFANPSGDAYAPVKTMDAWAKTLAFLDNATAGA